LAVGVTVEVATEGPAAMMHVGSDAPRRGKPAPDHSAPDHFEDAGPSVAETEGSGLSACTKRRAVHCAQCGNRRNERKRKHKAHV
jgi:hypothetical protein